MTGFSPEEGTDSPSLWLDRSRKPPEMYTLIENFCLGGRRLEAFGRPHSLRPGWVTLGDFELSPGIKQETGAREWDSEVWESELAKDGLGRALVPVNQGMGRRFGAAEEASEPNVFRTHRD